MQNNWVVSWNNGPRIITEKKEALNNNTTSINNTQPLFLESFAENYGVRERPSVSRAIFINLAREKTRN